MVNEMTGLEDDRQCWSHLNTLIVQHEKRMDATKSYSAIAAMIIEEASRLKNVVICTPCELRPVNHCDVFYGQLFKDIIRSVNLFTFYDTDDIIDVYLVVVCDNSDGVTFDVFTLMRAPLPGVVVNITHSVILKRNEISPYSD